MNLSILFLLLMSTQGVAEECKLDGNSPGKLFSSSMSRIQPAQYINESGQITDSSGNKYILTMNLGETVPMELNNETTYLIKRRWYFEDKRSTLSASCQEKFDREYNRASKRQSGALKREFRDRDCNAFYEKNRVDETVDQNTYLEKGLAIWTLNATAYRPAYKIFVHNTDGTNTSPSEQANANAIHQCLGIEMMLNGLNPPVEDSVAWDIGVDWASNFRNSDNPKAAKTVR
jgi:hypothetical protein